MVAVLTAWQQKVRWLRWIWWDGDELGRCTLLFCFLEDNTNVGQHCPGHIFSSSVNGASDAVIRFESSCSATAWTIQIST